MRGSPIRKPSDYSLVIGSPRLIADSYVLHRFLMPRHPPCALKNLKTTKMLASTMQFSNNTTSHAINQHLSKQPLRSSSQDPTTCRTLTHHAALPLFPSTTLKKCNTLELMPRTRVACHNNVQAKCIDVPPLSLSKTPSHKTANE